jgi:hypothetical protein
VSLPSIIDYKLIDFVLLAALPAPVEPANGAPTIEACHSPGTLEAPKDTRKAIK